MDFFYAVNVEKFRKIALLILFLSHLFIKKSQTKKYFKKKRYLLMRNKKMMYLCIDFELQNKHVKF
jgi:hypothetical protein